jgi:hypothetical protein
MEKIRSNRKTLNRYAAGAAGASLLLAGCGSSNYHVDASEGSVMNTGLLIYETYLQDGHRITEYHDFTSKTSYVDDTSHGFEPTLSYCDGHDLVDVSGFADDNTDQPLASSVSRTVNDPACNDGRLSPTDFPDQTRANGFVIIVKH